MIQSYFLESVCACAWGGLIIQRRLLSGSVIISFQDRTLALPWLFSEWQARPWWLMLFLKFSHIFWRVCEQSVVPKCFSISSIVFGNYLLIIQNWRDMMAAILKARRPVRSNNRASGSKLLDSFLALVLGCALVYNNKVDNQQTVRCILILLVET